MINVKKILQKEEGRYSYKIRNIYLNDGGKKYCDAYLNVIEGNWTILLDANHNRILLSKPQLEYLINKMQSLDTKISLLDEFSDYFGLQSGSGIKYNGKYYKLLFSYRTHTQNGDKMKYPFALAVKERESRYRVGFERMFLWLHEFKDILEKMLIGRGQIRLDHIYDKEKNEVVWEKKSYSQSKDNTNKTKTDNSNNKNHQCSECGDPISKKVADFSKRHYDAELCRDCQPNDY